MKNIILTGGVFASLLSAVSAFDLTFVNAPAADPTAVPIFDNAGNAITAGSGFLSAGTFSSVPTSLADISNFTPFGNGPTAFGGGAADGLFSRTRSAPIPFNGGSPLVGQSIYIVIGDGSTLADSDNFVIYDPGATFTEDNAAGAGGIAINIIDSTVSRDNVIGGQILQNVSIDGIPVTFNTGIGLAVPEPSTSLFAALAGLGLMARRRR